MTHFALFPICPCRRRARNGRALNIRTQATAPGIRVDRDKIPVAGATPLIVMIVGQDPSAWSAHRKDVEWELIGDATAPSWKENQRWERRRTMIDHRPKRRKRRIPLRWEVRKLTATAVGRPSCAVWSRDALMKFTKNAADMMAPTWLTGFEPKSKWSHWL